MSRMRYLATDARYPGITSSDKVPAIRYQPVGTSNLKKQYFVEITIKLWKINEQVLTSLPGQGPTGFWA